MLDLLPPNSDGHLSVRVHHVVDESGVVVECVCEIHIAHALPRETVDSSVRQLERVVAAIVLLDE